MQINELKVTVGEVCDRYLSFYEKNIGESVFAQQRSKYGYGYEFKEQRMLRQKLMLPVDASCEPDYEYMEQYSKNMMLKKYNQYLAYINRKGGKPVE